MIRTRFAPSPTGFVHIGSLRTALFSFLFARRENGIHVLRIEDTDQSRKVEGSVENLLKVMEELGIEFNEGALVENGKLAERGEFGPYLQSERLPIYKKHAEQLINKGNAYYCFCTQEHLEEVKKEQIALKKPARYDRACRNLSQADVKAKLEKFKAAGKNPVIRQAVPLDGFTTINDLIYGQIIYEHKVLDDQIILKSDGFPTYHLAVVVDDHLMQITHVIRGEEWIPSTAKHLLLYKAFGWEPTKFAHLPLILNPDKTKLSKRQGDVAVEDFLSKGYLKEALINFVAFLGWNPKTEKEIFSLDDLIKEFSLSNVNKAAAIFDTNKLDWMNGLYIRNKPLKELTELILPYWRKVGVDTDKYKREFLEAIVELRRPRIKTLSEIGERTGYFFTPPEYENEILIWKKGGKEDAKEKLQELLELFGGFADEDFNLENIEQKIKEFITSKNYQNGNVLWPLRVALSGQKNSPSPFEIASVLFVGFGKDEILKRIKTAINKL
ncbi:MAG: glutamate--tRNA ligase [Candidatus Doudnabacteria bacterium CG10_big_fil_rev_8_21_14_0_10_42_18]|uniref:Glutamate--tRNA ligase n=1 Tax=Candidatus Doudnabacteria bacterium CG10_big_fil_rev_8_21_14_0_10_42_18 TaxID=1974552 RepID=A0A2H0VCJ0_9BACT|nr:MAG: glutamate--tRNA ligase [Candidatus Doudnabacteria bacterium CG10_big_fil_rev_8_21_14_0_10_42_18]